MADGGDKGSRERTADGSNTGEKTRVVRDLEVALEMREIQKLKEALKAAEDVEIANSLVEYALLMLADLEGKCSPNGLSTEASILKMLEIAIELKDPSKLQAMLSRAKELKLENSVVEYAYLTLTDIEAKRSQQNQEKKDDLKSSKCDSDSKTLKKTKPDTPQKREIVNAGFGRKSSEVEVKVPTKELKTYEAKFVLPIESEGKKKTLSKRSPKSKTKRKTKTVCAKINNKFTAKEKRDLAERLAKRKEDNARKSFHTPVENEILRKLEMEMDGASLTEQPDSDEKEVCVESLIRGNINSYVDLFYLTHRAGSELPIVDRHKLPWIAQKLTEAENCERNGQNRMAYRFFSKVAHYFQTTADHSTAVHFFSKGKEWSSDIDENPELRIQSSCSLGDTYSMLETPDQAINCFKEALKKSTDMKNSKTTATALQDNYNIGVASCSLAKLHLRMARSCPVDEKKDILSAALRFARNFKEMANKTKNLENKSYAHKVIADVITEQGDIKGAYSEFLKSLKAAEDAESTRSLQKARAAIGEAELRNERFEEAVKHLEIAFELAKEMSQTSIRKFTYLVL
ncbi:hypothetical protein AAMO2058_000090900 [Amorphochlora amoebiformis]